MGIQGCAITAICLISNILPPDGLQPCQDQIIERRSDLTLPHILQNHVNFTWVNQTNFPDASATVTLKINSNNASCPVEWSGVAEGVPSNTPNPVTNNLQSAHLVHENVNFGGDWLNYRIWVNDTSCSPFIEEVIITYTNPETPCECNPDPQFKPEILGICTPDPCDHADAISFFGDTYPCICANTSTFDRCGVCNGDGTSCINTCCERVTPTAPLMAPYPYWDSYKRCEQEERTMPMEGMCYTIRSILADPMIDFPPPFGLRVGELTCDFGHDASQVILCVEEGGLHFNGTVWCGFDSNHANNHGDHYEPYQPPHPYTFSMWFTDGVDFSMPGMISVVEPNKTQDGDVSSEHCGYLISTIDDKDVTKVCAKSNALGQQLKITNGTNDFWEPGITGQGWFMNMNCSMPCDYCGNHFEESNTDPADMQRCNPGDWMWVLEAKCNLNSQSQSQSSSQSTSMSQSQSTSQSSSSSQSESASRSSSLSMSQSISPSQSISMSSSTSASHSFAPCCFLDYFLTPEICPGDITNAIPQGEIVACYDCFCNNSNVNYTELETVFNPRELGCCNGLPYPVGDMDCYNQVILDEFNCQDECCVRQVTGFCVDEPDECGIGACCCKPFIEGCPDIPDPCYEAVTSDPSQLINGTLSQCALWFENKGEVNQQLQDLCERLHSSTYSEACCDNKTKNFAQEEFCIDCCWGPATTLSNGDFGFPIFPESCPPLELLAGPPPTISPTPWFILENCTECLCSPGSPGMTEGCCIPPGGGFNYTTFSSSPTCRAIAIADPNCGDECCAPGTGSGCPARDCCCDPFLEGCPAAGGNFGDLTEECRTCLNTTLPGECADWDLDTHNAACSVLFSTTCKVECGCGNGTSVSFSQSASFAQSESQSVSSSISQSCPAMEIPPPPCNDRNLYEQTYHPETWDCVCQSGPWRCGECNGASSTACECPCSMTVNNQRVCDLYPHIPSAQCLFYQDCHPADEPEFIDYFKMYGLRSHSGWLKNNSFIDDRKKAPPLFGIVIGELVLDFSHKNSHVKMIVNWDSIHITGHAWGGYDLNNDGDNGIWDGWEALENMEPRVGPWKIDIWYTDGFQHDFSGVTGEPGEVSEVNCGTITDPKDWNNTIEICAKADDEGYQLRLENSYHGETGISGFGWFHNMLCDDRCGQFLNRYHCPDADMHFVLESECGDVQSPSESASPSPPKEPCCMRMNPVRFPNETITGQEPDKRRFHYYGDYGQETTSQSQSSSESQTPGFDNELLICDPTLSPFMIMPGAEYQLRDHFSMNANLQFPPPDGSIPGFPGHIVHGGLRFGNLYITFTEEGTLLKMFYQPGQDSVLIKGHGWGRVLDQFGDYVHGFEPGAPLGPQFYHVEMEYVVGLHHVHGIKRIPRGAGGVPFVVRERDPDTEKTIPIQHSKYNKGLLYPKDYPDFVVEYGAMDLPPPLFLQTDLIPFVETAQFVILSDSNLRLGINGGFHGLGALWANCSSVEGPKRRGIPGSQPVDPTVEALLQQMCETQVVRDMMNQEPVDAPDGTGWLNFVIEGECPCDNPSPSPGFCAEHGVYDGHGDPAENSLSHSQSPLQSSTPHPDVNTTYPGQGFSRIKGSTHIAVQMTETMLPPEKWNDPAIEYRTRQDSGTDLFGPGIMWTADTGYVVFTSDAFTTPYRFVTYNVAPAPQYELNGVRPGREWIFVQIQWNATDLPANFITKIAAGGVGDESPEKTQCGTGGGHNYTQCWIEFPPYGGVLYIGAATQPFYHLESDVELIGINLTMVAADKVSFVRHVGMGVYAPYAPDSDEAHGSDGYNLGIYMLAGLGFAGMAAGVMIFRPKSASAVVQQDKDAKLSIPHDMDAERGPRLTRIPRKGKGKMVTQPV